MIFFVAYCRQNSMSFMLKRQITTNRRWWNKRWIFQSVDCYLLIYNWRELVNVHLFFDSVFDRILLLLLRFICRWFKPFPSCLQNLMLNTHHNLMMNFFLANSTMVFFISLSRYSSNWVACRFGVHLVSSLFNWCGDTI